MNTNLPPFVKKFDFRGIYTKDIKDADAYFLGLALQQVLPLKKVLLGWDTRPSSKHLAMSVMQSMKHSEIDISYLDKCPIDYVTAAAHAFDFDLSIMFTGSHNPQHWTGLLLHTKGGESVQGELVTKIVEAYGEVSAHGFVPETVDVSSYTDFSETIEKIYAEKIQSLVPLAQIKPMDVLVDVGDGSGSKSLTILEKLLPQVTFSRINDRQLYDEASSHIADPSSIENMKDLIGNMESGSYACGFAFDSDADRVLAVDETGGYINGSLLGSAMIEVSRDCKMSDSLFGYAVDCGPSMHNAVMEINKTLEKKITVEPIPVGRSIMRKMIREGKLDIAVENVGHFYMKDFFMTDSGAFSIVMILYWISKNGALSNLLKKYPDGYREQLFSPVSSENRVEKLETELNNHFSSMQTKKIAVDGIRYEFSEMGVIKAWYAVRKSGYEAIEKYYFGALEDKDYTFIKQHIKTIIKE